MGAFAVYGYTKDENIRNKLSIDSFAADVVRDIFKWKLEGISAQGIADRLNQNGILSPMEYKRFLGLRYNTTFKVNTTARWQSGTVKRILTNAVYTGVLEQGKRTRTNYKIRKCADVPKEQWIRIENAHDAIIDQRVFETVQMLLKQDTRAVVKGGVVFPLSGVIICGDCGGAMVRKTYTKKDGSRDPYYICSKHRTDKEVCSTHIISANECETAVLNTLRVHTSAVLDVEQAINCAEDMAYRQDGVRKLTARLEAKKDEIQKYSAYRLSLHESYRDGIIQRADFISFQENYNSKIADKMNLWEQYHAGIVSAEKFQHENDKADDLVLKHAHKIPELEAQLREIESEYGRENVFVERFSKQMGIKELTRPIVMEFISEIRVYASDRIEIIFNYADEYTEVAKLVNNDGCMAP